MRKREIFYSLEREGEHVLARVSRVSYGAFPMGTTPEAIAGADMDDAKKKLEAYVRKLVPGAKLTLA